MANLVDNHNFSGPDGYRRVPGASGDCYFPFIPYWRDDPRATMPWDPAFDGGWMPMEFVPTTACPPYVDQSELIAAPATLQYTDWHPPIYPPGTRQRDKGAKRPYRLEFAGSQSYFSSGKLYHGGFKLTIVAPVGSIIEAGGRAHAWSNLNLAKIPGLKKQPPDVVHSGDANWSTGIGDGAYRAIARPGWPNIPSTGDVSADAIDCIGHRVGIDPTGADDPFAGTVVWGQWTIIANRFDNVEPVRAMAQSGHVTVFWESLCRWGLTNPTYWSSVYAEAVEVIPPVVEPEVDYVVVANLLPQDATRDEHVLVVDAVHALRQTILQSANDAKRLVQPGKMPGSKVVVWDPARQGGAGVITAYLDPCVVELKEFL